MITATAGGTMGLGCGYFPLMHGGATSGIWRMLPARAVPRDSVNQPLAIFRKRSTDAL